MDVILIGADGHAQVVVDLLAAQGDRIVAYIDPKMSRWLKAKRYDSENDVPSHDVRAVMGFAGATPEQLAERLAVFDGLVAKGFDLPSVRHPSAVVSPSARLETGAMVLAGVVVQPSAAIGRGAIVNTGAIYEHESVVEEGAHVPPGAIVLGGARIGACANDRRGGVVLQGATVAATTLVKAQSRYPG
jgi:hypothetical protein